MRYFLKELPPSRKALPQASGRGIKAPSPLRAVVLLIGSQHLAGQLRIADRIVERLMV